MKRLEYETLSDSYQTHYSAYTIQISITGMKPAAGGDAPKAGFIQRLSAHYRSVQRFCVIYFLLISGSTSLRSGSRKGYRNPRPYRRGRNSRLLVYWLSQDKHTEW